MEMEKIVVKYYDWLNQGKIFGLKDPQTGDIEWPPHAASNKTGSFDLEWVEMSGKGLMYSFTMPGIITGKPENQDLMPYAFGTVSMDGCDPVNVLVKGVTNKNKKELRQKLPMSVHAVIIERDGYDFVAFELDA